MTHNQDHIIQKILAYLRATNGEVAFGIQQGLCSGLVTFWLSCLANQRQKLFNETIDYILTSKISDDNHPDARMEEIISALVIMHYNMHYLENETQSNMQTSISLIKPDANFLELTENARLINTYNKAELALILETLPEDALVRLSNVYHTIGITKQHHQITIYDPDNNKSNQQYTPDQAVDELYKAFNQPNRGNLTIYLTCYNHPHKEITYNFTPTIINKPIIEQNTVLSLAIAAGDKDLVAQLINAGININDNSHPTYPIYTAISMHQHEIFLLLLKHGANLNVQTTGNSTLLHATITQNKWGYYQTMPVDLGFITLNLLLESGADPNFTNKDGISAASFAIYKGQLKKLALLIAYGADLTENDLTSLSKKYSNTTAIVQLCNDIKDIKQSIGKKAEIHPELLELAARSSHFKNLDLNQSWQLYELSSSLKHTNLTNKLATELIKNFTNIQQHILNLTDRNQIKLDARNLLEIINSINHFAQIKSTSIAKFRLHNAANSTLRKIQAHLTKILNLPNSNHLVQTIENIVEQNLAVTKRTQLTFLKTKSGLDFSTYPQSNKIMRLMFNR